MSTRGMDGKFVRAGRGVGGDITQELLQMRLRYEPETGSFFWIAGNFIGRRADRVFVDSKGGRYRRVEVLGKYHRAHRLAFMWMFGQLPKHEIDHINGDGTDNRACNLREVTRQQNAMNVRRARGHSSSGVLGVRRTSAGWSSSITTNKRRVRLGTFASADEAHAAYVAAKRKLHATCSI